MKSKTYRSDSNKQDNLHDSHHFIHVHCKALRALNKANNFIPLDKLSPEEKIKRSQRCWVI